jgi:hypothetical protein
VCAALAAHSVVVVKALAGPSEGKQNQHDVHASVRYAMNVRGKTAAAGAVRPLACLDICMRNNLQVVWVVVYAAGFSIAKIPACQGKPDGHPL